MFHFLNPRSRNLAVRKSRTAPAVLAVALLCSIGTRTGSATALQARQEGSEAAFFTSKILPILTARCQSCHNHTLKLSGLSLESAAAVETGGTHGPVVVPGNPEQSRLYRRVARIEKPFMPMDGDALPESEVTLLKTWIEQGAVWPEGVESNASVGRTEEPDRSNGETRAPLSGSYGMPLVLCAFVSRRNKGWLYCHALVPGFGSR